LTPKLPNFQATEGARRTASVHPAKQVAEETERQRDRPSPALDDVMKPLTKNSFFGNGWEK